jgi:vacuolar-type H+-ATPase subunit E/Vma4
VNEPATQASAPQPGIADPGAPASILDAQVEALLQRITADRDRRCSELQASAERQARELEHSARKEALANVREAIAKERKHAEQRLRQARASAALAVRQRAQQATRMLLTTMWAAVTDALEARWANSAQRKSWLQAAVRQAQALLSERRWRIEHGEGWRGEQRGELAKLAAQGDDRRPPREIELVSDAAVRAGIRIRASGACLDATVAGLLASRAQIESEFLAQYLAPSSGSPADRA